jgi:hypothetical protein
MSNISAAYLWHRAMLCYYIFMNDFEILAQTVALGLAVHGLQDAKGVLNHTIPLC